jgi:hypothetical protein
MIIFVPNPIHFISRSVYLCAQCVEQHGLSTSQDIALEPHAAQIPHCVNSNIKFHQIPLCRFRIQNLSTLAHVYLPFIPTCSFRIGRSKVVSAFNKNYIKSYAKVGIFSLSTIWSIVLNYTIRPL